MKRHLFSFAIIFVAIASLLAACTDDDSFTTSSSNLLTFSTDTVKLDTTFSRVPTATRTFWVYNHSGDGIRCSNIRLEGGNQNGFRVNVDGVYLGAAQGYQVNDVEVRNKDSIRVFVELTSPLNNGDGPQLVEDNLIFILESGQQQRVHLSAYSWDAELLKNVVISHDTTISSRKPIVIQGGLKVDSAATLTIAGGTTLYFANSAGINVYGRLLTTGSAENNVTLRGDRIDWMFDYLPYDRVPGQWQGIRFHESSYGNEINFTDIHSAYNGIVCDSADVSRMKLKLYNSIVHNCQGYGLVATDCNLDIYNCQITNTLHDCVAFFGGDITMRHCTLAQFYPFDSNRGAALFFSNNAADKLYPLQALNVVNTLITGYADDVVIGQLSDDAAKNYSFNHCLLRTEKPDTANVSHFVDVIYEDIKDTLSFGEKNFKRVDADKQYYDFHLDSISHAVDSAAIITGIGAFDRDGNQRDGKPDIGCYEYLKKN